MVYRKKKYYYLGKRVECVTLCRVAHWQTNSYANIVVLSIHWPAARAKHLVWDPSCFLE